MKEILFSLFFQTIVYQSLKIILLSLSSFWELSSRNTNRHM